MPKLGRRSEAHHIEYMYPNYSVTRNAPFGTNETPVQKPRIVGSKLVYTREDGNFGIPTWAQSSDSSRVNSPKRSGSRSSQSTTPVKLTPLSDNPTKFNPHALAQQAKIFASAQQDVHKSHLHHKDGFTSPVLNPHDVLPPIGTPLTTSHHTQHQSAPPGNVRDESGDWGQVEHNSSYNLAKYLPADGSYLPHDPIKLPKEEELELSRLIREEMTGFNTSKLKDIYLELTGFDRNLTGCTSFENLQFSLLRAKVGISSQNLRLVASLFISPNYDDGHSGDMRMVNYEKVLSFISAAQKPIGPLVADLRESPRIQTEYKTSSSPLPSKPATALQATKSDTGKRTNFNTVTEEDYSPRSKKFPYGDRNNSKLLRMIEQAIVDSGKDLDYDEIYSTFRSFDRGHREMLSRDQIKSLAAKCRIPLQESLMNSIINKLDSSNGQFSWVQFVEFLERVQPANTGLVIPESKRPADYAKHYPEPSPDWPKESHIQSPKQTDYMLNSDKKDVYYNEQQQLSELQPELYSDREETQSKKHELQETRSRPEDTIPQQQEGLEPWFERFMKLANALYDNDIDANGFLTVDEVNRLIRLHNETLDLGFDDDTVRRCVQSCATNGNSVPIDSLLKVLTLQHN